MKKKKKQELAEELLDDLMEEESFDEGSSKIEDSDIKIDFGHFHDDEQNQSKSEVPPPIDQIDLQIPAEPISDGDETQAHEPNANETKAGETQAAEVATEIVPVEKTDVIDVTDAQIPQGSFSLAAPFGGGDPSKTTGSARNLVDSENLKVAKQKIKDIEKENESLRIENEELASAAETFRNKVDNLQDRTVEAEKKYKDLYESVKAEKSILMDSIGEREKDNNQNKEKIKELELRLQTGVKKIRVRERELENRLELVKMEGKALLQSKDDMILNLKRQIDQVNMELENARNRIQESTKALNLKQDILRRTVKTLRLALSLLETEEAQVKATLKKVD